MTYSYRPKGVEVSSLQWLMCLFFLVVLSVFLIYFDALLLGTDTFSIVKNSPLLGAPWWLSRLGVSLLILVQVLILGVLGSIPVSALCGESA